MAKINVKNTEVTVIQINGIDYISLTDIAKFKTTDPNAVIGNWIRNRNTIEYLRIWECLYNPLFKPLEFEGFKKEEFYDYSKFILLIIINIFQAQSSTGFK
jgi:hypothetical protein